MGLLGGVVPKQDKYCGATKICRRASAVPVEVVSWWDHAARRRLAALSDAHCSSSKELLNTYKLGNNTTCKFCESQPRAHSCRFTCTRYIRGECAARTSQTRGGSNDMCYWCRSKASTAPKHIHGSQRDPSHLTLSLPVTVN